MKATWRTWSRDTGLWASGWCGYPSTGRCGADGDVDGMIGSPQGILNETLPGKR